MEILKVGDQFSIAGYKGITLTGDMSQNAAAFAEVNGISQSEAERILLASPAIKEFVASMFSNDVDEEYVLLGDFDDAELPYDTNKENGLSVFGKASAAKTSAAKISAAKTSAANTANNAEKTGSSSGATGSTTVKGVTFSFKLTADGSAPKITSSGNKITINGSNCEVTITANTNKNAQIVVKGSNLKVTLGAAVKSVTNYATGNTEINGYANGSNTIKNYGAGATINGGDKNDTITNYAKNAKINGGAGNDKITNSSKGTGVVISGGDGNDTIKNNAKNVTINGGAGNDKITNKGASTTINGDDGNDTITNTAKSVTINGGAGNDTITNKGASSTIHGNDGNDSITNTAKSVKIYGDAGNDKITNKGQSATINGGSGSDTISNKGAKSTITGGTGNDTISNAAANVTINLKDGKDTVNINSNSKNVKITNKENADTIKYKKKSYDKNVTIQTRVTTVVEGQMGSLSYALSKLGLTENDISDYETDNDGKVTKIFKNSSENYTLNYLSEGGMTITHNANNKVNAVHEFNSSGKKTKLTEYTYSAEGTITTETAYDDSERITQSTITGKDTNGNVKYILKDARRITAGLGDTASVSAYPELTQKATSLELKFATITITVNSGETVEIDTNGNVKVTKDGVVTNYTNTGVEIKQGADTLGSKEYLASLNSDLNMSNATDFSYDGEGKITAFKLNGKNYNVTYTGTNTVELKCTYSESETNGNYDYEVTTVYENKTIKSTDELITSKNGSTVMRITHTVKGYTNGQLSSTTQTITYNNESGATVGTVNMVYSNFTNGHPGRLVMRGLAADGTTVNFEVESEYTAADEPGVVSWDSAGAVIKFVGGKTLNVKNGAKAVIASDGTVTLTYTDENGASVVKKFDKNGTEQNSVITNPPVVTPVPGGSYTTETQEETDADGTTTTITIYKGYEDGKTNPSYTIKYNNPNNNITVIPGATNAIIRYEYTDIDGQRQIVDITINKGDNAEIGADGKLTVQRADGTVVVYNSNGSKQSEVREVRTTNPPGRVVDTKKNFNDDGTYTHIIEGYSDVSETQETRNYRIYNLCMGTNEQGYPKFERSADSIQIKLSAHASVTVNYGSEATLSADGRTLTVRQLNGVVLTYVLGEDDKFDENQPQITKPSVEAYPEQPDEPELSDEIKEVRRIIGLFDNGQGVNPLSVNDAEAILRTLVKSDDKIEFTFDGKTYTVILENGNVARTEIVDLETEEVTPREIIPEDVVKKLDEQIAGKTDELCNDVVNLIQTRYSYDIRYKVTQLVKQAIKDFAEGKTDSILNRVRALLMQNGMNAYPLAAAMKENLTFGVELENLIKEMASLTNARETAAAEAEARPTRTKIVSINGVSFQITYPKEVDPKNFKVEEVSGAIVITAPSECTIDVLGTGEGKSVIINGSKVTFNSNATTFARITNNADDSVITGSYGNDNIINNGENTTIRGLEGNDNITNNGASSTVDAGAGNDTVINNASGAVIRGGAGNDIITNNENAANVTINCGAGSDKITNSGTNATINGDGGNDYVYNRGSGAIINGGNGADHIYSVHGTANVTQSSEDVIGSMLRDDSRFLAEDDPDSRPIAQNKPGVVTPEDVDTSDNSDDPCTPAEPDTPVTPSTPGSYSHTETKEVTVNGQVVRYTVYSNSDVNVTASTDDLHNLLTINAQDCKIVINSAPSNLALIIRGDGLDFSSDVLIGNGISNYANNSTIKGSSGNDYIYNYGSHVKVEGLAGNDVLYNENDTTDVVMDGGDGADKFVNYKNTSGVTIVADSSDISFDDRSGKADIDCPGGGCFATDNSSATAASVAEYLSKSSLSTSLGLTSTEQAALISKYYTKFGNDYSRVQAFIESVEVILSSANDTYSQEQIAAILRDTTGTLEFNNEILQDAQVVATALKAGTVGSAAYNASIKSQMIKDGSSWTTAQMFSNTTAGEVVEKGGKLYVNDGSKMVELSISATTYLNLFPPVSRFLVEQNDYNDCFFIATAMVDFMENPIGRAKLLQMFSEQNGNITVTIPGVSSYPITFTNGELKATDGRYTVGGSTVTSLNSNGTVKKGTTAALGLQMLEQAYALAKFAQLSNTNITSSDLEELGKELYNAAKDARISSSQASSIDMDKALSFYSEGGYAQYVYDDLDPAGLTDGSYARIETETQGRNLLAECYSLMLANPKCMVTTLIPSTANISDSDKTKYGLLSGHQYSIEEIDPAKQIVKIKNPWDTYKVTEIPYSVFLKYFYGLCSTALS